MRPEQSLETKLDAYEALSDEDRAAGKARQNRWAVYAAAAGSSLALTTSVDAGIVYSGVKNLTATASTNGPPAATLINIDGGFFVDKAIRVSNSHKLSGSVQLNGLGAGKVLLGGGVLKNLASGAKVSSGAGIFGAQGTARRNVTDRTGAHSTKGVFPQSHTGFAGIEINKGTHHYFGWVRLEWKGSALDGLSNVPKSMTAIDWAYDTVAGQSIKAGQESLAVPEPSSGMLALLAAGSVGVLAWRARRRQETVNAQPDTEALG